MPSALLLVRARLGHFFLVRARVRFFLILTIYGSYEHFKSGVIMALIFLV